ncbi:acyltransferase family protein [Massilia cavernae]|uniref:Acyltransferase n=1 Tax=Massilia cavernae TaxID=2320864 RepID=A0A418Y7Z5_9BURK|nr:acyltransferase [Massilia cavernae]RJG27285.1 acyltransferase [Massilia cavernae]
MRSLNIPYNPRTDQLRWLAATMVFLFHFHGQWRGLGGAALESPWTGLVTEGHTGVGLFFTLSGFLFMQIALHVKSINYRDFMRNRFLRIFPLFFLVFLVATSIGRDKFQPQDIFYLFATNLGLAPTSQTVITGAAWTISLEFMFYAIFPFLARFAMERGPRYLFSLLALLFFFKVAAYTVNQNSTLMFFSTFVGRFDQFLIGMLAAMLYQQHSLALHRRAGWLVPLTFMLAIAGSALQSKLGALGVQPRSAFWIVWSTLESSVWACVILAWVSFDKALPAWLERVMIHGGKISFSFYLLHMGVLHVVAQAMHMYGMAGKVTWAHALLMLPLAYAATWALSALSYNTIEEPFLRMRRCYGAVKPVPLASAA